ncbi:MAG: hypothetical protein ACFBSG_15500 [Leptolyngbyaceae cyanobacterium]
MVTLRAYRFILPLEKLAGGDRGYQWSKTINQITALKRQRLDRVKVVWRIIEDGYAIGDGRRGQAPEQSPSFCGLYQG